MTHKPFDNLGQDDLIRTVIADAFQIEFDDCKDDMKIYSPENSKHIADLMINIFDAFKVSLSQREMFKNDWNVGQLIEKVKGSAQDDIFQE